MNGRVLSCSVSLALLLAGLPAVPVIAEEDPPRAAAVPAPAPAAGPEAPGGPWPPPPPPPAPDPTHLRRYTLTLVAGPGGTVAPSSGRFRVGTSIAIQATPDSLHSFGGWVGTGPGSYTGLNAGATVVMNGDVTQTATFVPMYTLTMPEVPGGSVFPGSGAYPESTLVLLSATPDPGYTYGGWTGTGPGSYTGHLNVVAVRMLGDITQTASFPAIPVYTLTMVAGPGGTVAPATGTHLEGTQIDISAAADTDFLFAGWVGTGPGSYTGSASQVRITVNGDITQTAGFTPIPYYTLTMNAAAGGTATPPSGSYRDGTSVLISAKPDTGWVFDGWIGTGLGSYTGPSAGFVIQVLSDITQTPSFSYPPTHPLVMFVGTGGTASPPSGDYPNGATLSLVAVPDSGYVFDRWGGTGVGSYSGSANPASIQMGGPVLQNAYFLPRATLTVTTVPPGKRISVDGVDHVSPYTFDTVSGTQHALDVDAVSPSTVPGTRDVFQAWEDGTARTDRTVSVPGGLFTYTATYTPEYLLDFQDPPEVVSSPGPGYHAPGTVVTIQATTTPSYVFDQWIGTGAGSYTGPNNPATVTMNGPITQAPRIHQLGYDFAISASATDPLVQTDPPAGAGRLLYLWLICAEDGISAFEADVTGTLVPDDFIPFNGVLNTGTATSLLLAVPGCPGAAAPFLLGAFLLDDPGGDLCLAPSSANGILGAVDCTTFGVTDPVQVIGFSSSGGVPCFLPGASCLISGPARGGETAAVPGPVPAPLQDAYLGVRPNPFRDGTEFRLAVAAPAHVRISVYDVTGRLVTRVADGRMVAGRHSVAWDGRADSGTLVPAGVYFARVEIGAFSQSRKIVRLGVR